MTSHPFPAASTGTLIDDAVAALGNSASPAAAVAALLALDGPDGPAGAVAAAALERKLDDALAPVARAWVTAMAGAEPGTALLAALGRLSGPGEDQAGAHARALGNPWLTRYPLDAVELADGVVRDLIKRLHPSVAGAFPAGPRYADADFDDPICGMCDLDCRPDECLGLRARMAYAHAVGRVLLVEQLAPSAARQVLERCSFVDRITAGDPDDTPAQQLWAGLAALAGHRLQMRRHHATTLADLAAAEQLAGI